jgi:hypothetical protein
VSCASKRSYGSKAAAKRALKRVQSIIPNTGAKTAYRCPACGFWHLTSRERRPASAIHRKVNPTDDNAKLR